MDFEAIIEIEIGDAGMGSPGCRPREGGDLFSLKQMPSLTGFQRSPPSRGRR